MKGANPNVKNQLEDSPISKYLILLMFFILALAKRYGNHDIVLLFSA
jgi:hypothetical protein